MLWCRRTLVLHGCDISTVTIDSDNHISIIMVLMHIFIFVESKADELNYHFPKFVLYSHIIIVFLSLHCFSNSMIWDCIYVKCEFDVSLLNLMFSWYSALTLVISVAISCLICLVWDLVR